MFIPSYLEEQAIDEAAGVVVESMPIAPAGQRVDWALLIADTEGKIALLRKKIEDVEKRPWLEQVEARDRVIELNGELLAMLSQL